MWYLIEIQGLNWSSKKWCKSHFFAVESNKGVTITIGRGDVIKLSNGKFESVNLKVASISWWVEM